MGLKKELFKKNIELDAQMVYVSKQADSYELMNFRFKNLAQLPNNDSIDTRTEWLKIQDEEYRLQVNKRAEELKAKK